MKNMKLYFMKELKEFLLKAKTSLYNEKVYQFIEGKLLEIVLTMDFDRNALLSQSYISSTEVFLCLSETDTLNVKIINPHKQSLKILFRQISGQNIETLEIVETARRTLFTQNKRYGTSTCSVWSLHDMHSRFIFSKKRGAFLYFDKSLQTKRYALETEEIRECSSETHKMCFLLDGTKGYVAKCEFLSDYTDSQCFYGKCDAYDPVGMIGGNLDIKTTYPPHGHFIDEAKGQGQVHHLKSKLLLPPKWKLS